LSLRQEWKTERMRYKLEQIELEAEIKLTEFRAAEYAQRMREIVERAKQAQLAKEKPA